jgi:hypothetical protein
MEIRADRSGADEAFAPRNGYETRMTSAAAQMLRPYAGRP